MKWWRIVLLVVLLSLPLAPVPSPKLAHAQDTRCPEAAARAQPLPGDRASATMTAPDGLAAWRIDGAVGKIEVKLSGLTSDLDLFVCGPDGRIAGNSLNEGTADEAVSLVVDGPADYVAAVFADPGRPGSGSYQLSVDRLSSENGWGDFGMSPPPMVTPNTSRAWHSRQMALCSPWEATMAVWGCGA